MSAPFVVAQVKRGRKASYVDWSREHEAHVNTPAAEFKPARPRVSGTLVSPRVTELHDRVTYACTRSVIHRHQLSVDHKAAGSAADLVAGRSRKKTPGGTPCAVTRAPLETVGVLDGHPVPSSTVRFFYLRIFTSPFVRCILRLRAWSIFIALSAAFWLVHRLPTFVRSLLEGRHRCRPIIIVVGDLRQGSRRPTRLRASSDVHGRHPATRCTAISDTGDTDIEAAAEKNSREGGY